MIMTKKQNIERFYVVMSENFGHIGVEAATHLIKLAVERNGIT